MRKQKPAGTGGMRRLDGHLRGAVFDHLDFSDALRATATDRASRAALGCVSEVHKIGARSLSCASIVSKLTACKYMHTHARSSKDLTHLMLPLTILKDLHRLTFTFINADMSTWAEDCDRLVRTGALRQARSLVQFKVARASSRTEIIRALDENELRHAAYKSLLLQLPLDCALRASVYGQVPAAVCRELIARGANVNSVVKECSVLRMAVDAQRIAVIRALLEAGADPNYMADPDCLTILADAMFREEMSTGDAAADVVMLLLEFGANAGYASPSGCNALHIAAENCWKQSWEVTLTIAKILLNEDETLASGLWTSNVNKTCETPLATLMDCHASPDLPPGAAAFGNLLARAESRNRFNGRKRR
jgi:hypothetical protein